LPKRREGAYLGCIKKIRRKPLIGIETKLGKYGYNWIRLTDKKAKHEIQDI
jgi:hypothetical protein